MKKVSFLLLALSLFFQVGCTKSVRYSEEEIRGFPPSIQEHIRKGEVTLGMTQPQVRYSWGSPDSVTILPSTEDGKTREEWVYGRLGGVFKTRLIFTDRKLTEIISTDPGIRK